MKKYIVFAFLSFFLFFSFVSAKEVVIEERTEENRYGIPSRFELNDTTIESAKTIPYIEEEELVYDFAQLYTDSEYEKIQSLAKDLNDKLPFRVVIVTQNNIGSRTAMEYADDFYDYNDFGPDGVLLLIAMDVREVYISTAGDAIGTISNPRVETILDSVYSYLSSGNYAFATERFLSKVDSYYELGRDSTVENYKVLPNGEIVFYKKLPIFPILFISLVVSFVCTLIIVKSYKKITLATNANEYISQGNVIIKNIADQYVNSVTTRTYSPVSSDSGGSSGHSGGGYHSSSSGASHGGGGRHF